MESHEGWTVNTLYLHFSKIIAELEKRTTSEREANDKALAAALVAIEKATQETKHQTDKWQANSNEWRGAMTEKDRNFVTKREIWGYAVGMVGMILGMLEIFQRFTIR
jgi:hypothetical protein